MASGSSSELLTALALSVTGSAANNIGKVLQKRATAELPQLSLDKATLKCYLTSKTWKAGVLADVGGALLILISLSKAPVSVIQPVAGCGIAILAIFSHFYLREELQNIERLWVTVALIGTIGIGLTATPPEDRLPNTIPLSMCFLSFFILVGLLETLSSRAAIVPVESKPEKPRLQSFAQAINSPLADAMMAITARHAAGMIHQSVELIAGVQAGVLFGLSSASARTGMLFGQLSDGSFAPVAPILGVAGSILLSSYGIFCQNRGMKEGRAVLVCTFAAVATIITGVIAGLLALNEHMPEEGTTGWFLSLILILGGICLVMRRDTGKHMKYDKETV